MSLNRTTLALASLLVCASAVPVTGQQPRATRADNEPSASGNSSYASDPWHQTLHDFDEWAQIQRLYSKQQVTEMREKILEKIVNLSTEESERFRDDVNAKLHVMMSAEARDARKWLNDTLAVASDSYAAKIRAKLPDVVKESPNELQADLDKFEARETNVKQYQKGMQETRELQVKALEANARRQAEANAKARAASTYNPAPGGATSRAPRTYQRYSSPYGPTSPYSIGYGYRYW